MALLLHQPLLPEGSAAAAVGSPLPSRSGRGGEGQQHGDALEAATSPPLSSSSPPPPLPSPDPGGGSVDTVGGGTQAIVSVSRPVAEGE
uniref:Uncharacterized protein n=1 Tax=Oryza sativa subsp. japonica TaxID=39947 RepID=Q5Z7I4_ORYSJ|nr:hypothetical protein [Oryza sativa Japonica Group]